jgi:glycosyltransferase involved in cell wall biosynthesis
MAVSIILPARNEADALGPLLRRIRAVVEDAEIIVVNDGSDDETARVAEAVGAHVINHPYGLGNGAAIKAGARAAGGDVLVFLDADGQHDPGDIPRLLAGLEGGYDMVVGARTARSQANVPRLMANALYNWFASIITGHRVADLTSGLRAVNAQRFRRFLYLLPNGFSYPATITMAFFRSGYPVAYVPIEAGIRSGRSHIRPLSDGVRFLLIMFKISTLYSPLKIFVPVSASFFLVGWGYYLYTYLSFGRFSNMTALLLSASVLVFMMGLVSEQITALYYRDSDG